MICDNFKKSVNVQHVILAGLFHDMGNIIKSDLAHFLDFVEPEGIEYWESVKSEFLREYGDDAHSANVAIAKKIGLFTEVVSLIDNAGFSRMEKIFVSESFELKVFEYGDIRVGPRGILSIAERLAEARARYEARIKLKSYYETDDDFEKLSNAALKLEKQIFEHVTLTPADINDRAVEPLIKELWDYPIS